jgi:hypothetical protein
MIRTKFGKAAALGAAALTLAFVLAPINDAEAQYRRPGAGVVRPAGPAVGPRVAGPRAGGPRRGYRGGRGAGIAAGVLGAAIVGGALLNAGRPAYGAPVYGAPVYVEEGPSCYFVRERVWDDYRERWVRVRRRVCE